MFERNTRFSGINVKQFVTNLRYS